MRQTVSYCMLAAGIAFSFFAQQPPRGTTKPQSLHAESPSSVSLSAHGDEQTLEIRNVTHEASWESVPDRPRGERLLLRKTTSSKQVLGDIGQEATTTLEAWPLGVDLKRKPLYAIKVSGTGGQVVDGALFVADRGLEEVEWWSAYRLGNGQHLFDTYVPVVRFSISRQVRESRYVGLEVPADDTPDPRLRQPNVIAVITYASQARVRKEVLLTSEDAKQAMLLRSYADTFRTLAVTEEQPPRALKLSFHVNDTSPAAPVIVTLPLSNDDLDLTHAQIPKHLHVAAWKR